MGTIVKIKLKKGALLLLPLLGLIFVFQNFSFTAPPAGKNMQPSQCAANFSREEYFRLNISPQPLTYMDSMADPNFPAFFVRVTDTPKQTPPTNPSEYYTGAILRHEYPKTSAWNADGSLLHLPINRTVELQNGQWGLGWANTKPLFLDGKTYQPKYAKSSGLTGVVWERWNPYNDPTTKFLRYYARNVNSTTSEFGWWNVETGVVTRLQTFSDLQFSDAQNTESSPSDDGRFVALAAKRVSSGKSIALIYEVYATALRAEIDLSKAIFDNVGISSRGTYLVVNGCFVGASCYNPIGSTIIDDYKFDSHKVYKWKDGVAEVQYFPEFGRPSHFDFAIDSAGEEVIVGTSKCSVEPSCANDVGSVIKRRLRDGVVTRLTPKVNGNRGGFPSHTSTRNIARPGWAYVTYMRQNANDPGAWGPYFDEVVAVKLDGSLQTQRLFRTYNTSMAELNDYWTQAQAVPSPDGRRVIFTSNWQGPPAYGMKIPAASYVAHPCIDGNYLKPVAPAPVRTNVAMGKPVLSRTQTNFPQYIQSPAYLTDNSDATHAYPAFTSVDYEIDLQTTELVNQVDVVLGYFGTSSIFINSWQIEGLDANGKVIGSYNGGYPNTAMLSFPNLGGVAVRKIRFRAQSSANWFGIYEIRVWANK